MSVAVKASQLDELEQVGAEILNDRQHHITDGKLGGRHWFLAVLAEAKSVLRRRRAWDSRRARG